MSDPFFNKPFWRLIAILQHSFIPIYLKKKGIVELPDQISKQGQRKNREGKIKQKIEGTAWV